MSPENSLVKGFELTLNIQGVKFNCILDSVREEQAYLLVKNTDIPMGLILLAKDLNAMLKPAETVEVPVTVKKPKKKAKKK